MEASGNNNNPPSHSTTTAAPSSPGPGPVARTGSPPWTQIVRGPDSDPAGTPSSPSAAAAGEQNNPPPMTTTEIPPAESSDNGNAGSNKKPAWNKKPSNGPAVVDNSGPVVMAMGASSWPALSESTKASPKLSSSDSSKSLSDYSGSTSSPQVTGIVTSLSSSSLMASSPLPSPSSLSSPKLTTSNANHNPNFNHQGQGRPARQKSMKRDGGGGGSNSQANGGFSHSGEGGSHNHSSNSKSGSGGGGFEGSNRDNTQNHMNVGSRNAAGGGGGGVDHHPQQHRNSFRRGGNGGRGDGSYSGRRGNNDHDRPGNHDWKNFNGRDVTFQPRAAHRGFARTPPVSTTFVHPAGPAPIRPPFMNPMGLPDMPVVYFPAPFVAPVPGPMYFPTPDPQLQAKITSQIDYYFSNENLIKDTFLRQNMNAEGWVPVTLIAGFKKVKLLTDNIQLILEAVESSSVVEAQGDKIRKRDDWKRWIMPPAVKFPVTSGSQSPRSPNVATVSAHIQSVTLDEMASSGDAEALLRSSSGDLSSPSTKDGASSSGC